MKRHRKIKDSPRCFTCGGRLPLKPDKIHKCQSSLSRSFVCAQPKDITYGDTWNTRRKVLGERSYQDFLQSPQWAALKEKARSREHFRYCWICGTTKRVELHHTSYRWINLPTLQNVRPICRDHHELIHKFAREKRISVRLATRKIFKLFKRSTEPSAPEMPEIESSRVRRSQFSRCTPATVSQGDHVNGAGAPILIHKRAGGSGLNHK